jgi:hypothetical protein
VSPRMHFIAAAVAAAFAASGYAQTGQKTLSEQTQESAARQIEAEHKAALDRCATLRDNAVDVCRAEADGRRRVAEARLQLERRNTSENLQGLARAQANAQYRVENERCDNLQGEASKACQKQAQMNRDKAEAAIQDDREQSGSAGSGQR